MVEQKKQKLKSNLQHDVENPVLHLRKPRPRVKLGKLAEVIRPMKGRAGMQVFRFDGVISETSVSRLSPSIWHLTHPAPGWSHLPTYSEEEAMVRMENLRLWKLLHQLCSGDCHDVGFKPPALLGAQICDPGQIVKVLSNQSVSGKSQSKPGRIRFFFF